METLIDLLEEIDDEIDWEYESRLVDDRILDSLTVITMIADLENAFDVEIRAEEITLLSKNLQPLPEKISYREGAMIEPAAA